MSPELLKETIVASVSAVCAVVPSAILVWWTWRRDQENVIVQKSPLMVNGLDGSQVLLRDTLGTPKLRVLIRNRSLFPVRVSAVGFNIDGTVFQMESPIYPLRMIRNPDARSSQIMISDDRVDANEIQSGAYIIVESESSSDSTQLRDALENAASKRKISVEKLIMSKRVQALAVLESGRQFASGTRKMRVFKWIQKCLFGKAA